VLGADGFHRHGLALSEGCIAGTQAQAQPRGQRVDLRGFLILPGIVDLHGDGFERHLAPRRAVVRDLAVGLAALDAELAANGITTAVLAQLYSWEGGMRGPEFARRLLQALATGGDSLGTSLRVQLRLETHMLENYADFETLVARFAVPYVVFNDHLPHRALAQGKTPPRLVGQALKGGRSPEAHLRLMQQLHGFSPQVPAAAGALARRLAAQGVLLGSHDDSTAQQRAQWRAHGLRIAEFPTTQAAAAEARSGGDAIVLGAPNVMRGGSHTGNVAAAELIRQGLCDALVSDYHYPSLHQAALALATKGMPLAKSWHLISSTPARILGLSDRGSLQAGMRADLVVLNRRTSRIEGTLTAGRITWLSRQAAARFIASQHP